MSLIVAIFVQIVNHHPLENKDIIVEIDPVNDQILTFYNPNSTSNLTQIY